MKPLSELCDATFDEFLLTIALPFAVVLAAGLSRRDP
jgi:hypothetical protein